MHIKTWRFYFFLLSWIILVQKCEGQTTLLTLIDDMCITNTSSAMAMIYDLSDPSLRTMEQLEEKSEIRSKDKKTGEIEGMCLEPECFSSKYWHVINSLESQEIDNLITDKRWEDFPVHVTKNSEKEGEFLDYKHVASFPDSVTKSHKVIIPFSVHVANEAHVFLCDGDQVPESNCYWFMLQAWNSLQSGFRKCKVQEIQNLNDGKAPKGFCDESTIRWEHGPDFPKFLSEYQWNHFKIVKTGNKYSLEHSNGVKIFSVNTSDFQILPRNLFFHTKAGIGLWKVHKFNYFYTETPTPLEFTRTLTLPESRNCLSIFAAMCTNCKMGIEFYESNWYDFKELATNKLNVQDEGWREVKLVFNMSKSKKDVHFRIIPKSSKDGKNFWAFMDLRPCNLHEIRVLKPAHPHQWTQTCQHIGRDEIVNIAENRKISTLENYNKCNEHQFGEDCLPCKLVYNGTCARNRKYCQLIKTEDGLEHKCYCSIGNEGENCEENCRSSYKYGHGCRKSCGNCQDSCSKDPVDGKCDRKYCENNYIGEKCDTQSGIFIFDNLPEIEVRPTSCYITMTLFDGKGDPEKPPQFYKIQYKKEKEEWRDVGEEPFHFNEPEKIVLANLNSGSFYSIRVFGFNSETDLEVLNLTTHEIPTQDFQTRCYDINETQIEIYPDKRSARIWIKSNKVTCDISKYTFIINNQLIRQRTTNFTIDELEPFTKYSFTIEKDDNKLFTKFFQTIGSEPGRVQNVHCLNTTKPTDIILQWSKPKKTNGILLYYRISFQLKRHLVCDTNTKSEELRIDLPASSESLQLENLKPYAEYEIDIKANTSDGYGESVSLIVSTNSNQFMSPEEIPKLETTSPGSDYVKFNFLVASCEKITGPIYGDVTLIGTESWCNETKVLKALDLTRRTIEINELKPFCKYNAALKFYRRDDKIEKEESTEFETLASVPNKITQLEVTSKGNNHISLRWLPPYPPTGQITDYKISHCYTPYWMECNARWTSEVIEPKSCKLWPDYQCYTIESLVAHTVYTVKVQAKNKCNNNYSEAVKTRKIITDGNQKSNPPYGVTIKWTEENHLYVTWYHPNITAGIISAFRIYVNGIKHEYKINSENDYYLVYNYTVKSNLTLPDFYTVEVAACNPAGESNMISISESSPPPIPEDSIEKTEANEEQISVTFKTMKQYKIVFKRFLYVLITDCYLCQDELDIFKVDLLSHHAVYNEIKSVDKIVRHQWKVIETYTDMEMPHNYPRKLEIGRNTTNNIYAIKPKTKYLLAFISINRLGDYVRMNTTIITTMTELAKAEI